MLLAKIAMPEGLKILKGDSNPNNKYVLSERINEL